MVLRIATRGSPLALTQARMVRDALAALLKAGHSGAFSPAAYRAQQLRLEARLSRLESKAGKLAPGAGAATSGGQRSLDPQVGAAVRKHASSGKRRPFQQFL